MQIFDKRTLLKPESELYIASISKVVRKHGSQEENQPITAGDQTFIDNFEAKFSMTFDFAGNHSKLGEWKSYKYSQDKYTVYRVVV